MVEKANSTTASASTYGNQLTALPKATEVRPTPVAPPACAVRPPASTWPVMMITRAVMVQITTVSMKGSSSAAKPCDTGWLVCTAECAMAAEPTPASLENAARLKPWISAPTTPPTTPSDENAPRKIWPKAQGKRST